MRALLVSLLASILVHGETIDILAIEVSQRLVEPTLARSLGGDREELDDALTKLRKLAPDKGVTEHASISLDLGNGTEKIGKSGMEIGPDIPGRGQHYRQFGWSLVWDPTAQSRKLEIKPHATLTSAPVFIATLVHPLDARWSLSAATTTPKGALFIFEKIDGRKLLTESPVWVAASLLSGNKPSNRVDIKPEHWFSANAQIRSSILREPSDNEHSCSIMADFKPFCGAWKNYSESSTTFSTQMGTEMEAGMVVSTVVCKYLDEIQPTTHTENSGSFHHGLGIGRLPITSTDPFVIGINLVERNGNTTTSKSLPTKKPEQRHLQTLIFRSN